MSCSFVAFLNRSLLKLKLLCVPASDKPGFATRAATVGRCCGHRFCLFFSGKWQPHPQCLSCCLKRSIKQTFLTKQSSQNRFLALLLLRVVNMSTKPSRHWLRWFDVMHCVNFATLFKKCSFFCNLDINARAWVAGIKQSTGWGVGKGRSDACRCSHTRIKTYPFSILIALLMAKRRAQSQNGTARTVGYKPSRAGVAVAGSLPGSSLAASAAMGNSAAHV